jgi:two-component system chemotaxis response regulator CheB
MTFQALEAGALAILAKPPARTSQSFPLRSYEFLMTFKAMAGVKVVRRLAKPVLPSAERLATPPPVAAPVETRLIAIGASTGGPQVVHEILSHLSPAIRVPIVIVQHISPGFEAGFAAWLDHTTGLPVTVAASGEQLKDGHVYIAPTGYHLELSRDGLAVLARGPLEHGVCPSISRFFRSVARSYGKAAIGVILTGMGTDGAAELKLLREAGAETIAQDKETSVVHGMPGEAIKRGGAVHILPMNAIAAKISALLHPG